MTVRNKSNFTLSLLLPVLFIGGCATAKPPEKTEDPRLDQLLSDVSTSLANQAAISAQLQEQQRGLELQQQQLWSLHQEMGKSLRAPVVSNCPPVVPCPKPQETTSKLVVGGLEQVWLSNLDVALPARIDTGAETSSLDARNIEQFERDGKPWVRFEIINSATGTAESHERRLKRTVGVHQSGTTEMKRRPVIKMGITIGQINQTAEFTLSDRSHLDYQVLIGRNVLQDVMVVDVSKKNIAPYVVQPVKAPDSKGAK